MTASVSVPMPVFIAQWVLLGGLVLLVTLVYRQLAYLMRLSDGVSSGGGLELGTRAPGFEYRPARTPLMSTRTFEPTGAASILLFADPACPSCERAVTGLASAVREAPVRALVVTQASEEVIGDFETFRTTPLELVRAEHDLASRLYETAVTPCFYGIDQKGVIRAKAVTDRESDIRRLLEEVQNYAASVPDDSSASQIVALSSNGGDRGG